MLLVHRAHKHTKLWMQENKHYTMMLCLAVALQRSVRFFCRPAFYFPAHRTGTLHAIGAQGTQTHKNMVLGLCIAKECEIFLQASSPVLVDRAHKHKFPWIFSMKLCM